MFEPATPTAILWLLSGYNIDLADRSVVIVGRGRLVGGPLEKLLDDIARQVTVVDKDTSDLKPVLADAQVIISATGMAGAIAADMIPEGAVVVDAGVSVEAGVAKGDLAEDVYGRDDLKISAKVGGVGPLTVCALFENVIVAARNSIQTDQV